MKNFFKYSFIIIINYVLITTIVFVFSFISLKNNIVYDSIWIKSIQNKLYHSGLRNIWQTSKNCAKFANALGSGSLSIFSSAGALLNQVGADSSSGGSITETATANPTANVTNSYLRVGDRGIRMVKIDIDDYLKNPSDMSGSYVHFHEDSPYLKKDKDAD